MTDPTGLLLCWTVVAAAAFVQASCGFGFSLLAVPLLSLAEPGLVPGPVLLLSVALCLALSGLDRDAVRHRDLPWLLGGRVVGVGASLAAGAFQGPGLRRLLVPVLVTIAVPAGLVERPVPGGRGVLVGAGALSGWMGTTAALGGPPLAVLYRDRGGPVVRGTLSTYFVLGGALSLAGLGAVGRLGHFELTAAATLAPGLAVGLGLARRLQRVIDDRRLVLVASAVAFLAAVVHAVAAVSVA